MDSKFLPIVAAGLLASTVVASAQPSGAPSNERDVTGQPADSSTNSAMPDRPAVVNPGPGTVGGETVIVVPPPGGSSVPDPLPGEPTRGAAPRQGEGSGDDAIQRRK
jgi:hypothetical protein